MHIVISFYQERFIKQILHASCNTNSKSKWISDDIKAQQDTANATEGAPAEGAAEKDNEEDGEGRGPGGEGRRERRERDVTPEPPTFTLEEWKAQQEKKNQPKFNLRKAGEGSVEDPKWKKAFAYKKEKETVEEDEDEVIFPARKSSIAVPTS